MVKVGIVQVPVRERHMPMPVAVRLARRVCRPVRVTATPVMDVPMLVLDGLVAVRVVVHFGHVEVDADDASVPGTAP